jgi:hypothetical protein
MERGRLDYRPPVPRGLLVSYFLMQHHNGPTRLLDWSDGALMALHFALRNKADDSYDARVYVLESYRLSEQLKQLPDVKIVEENWKTYVAKHPSYELQEDEWEDAYLPADEEDLAEINVPRPPLVLDFPLITRRIAAQRSRFIVFGTEPNWALRRIQESKLHHKRQSRLLPGRAQRSDRS